jgi:hypothetical protein
MSRVYRKRLLKIRVVTIARFKFAGSKFVVHSAGGVSMNAGLPLHLPLDRHENDCRQVNPGNAILRIARVGAWTCTPTPADQVADRRRFT